MTRPSFDEYYLGIAAAAAARGECTRSKVGAIIVLKLSNYHLTAIGYNGVDFGKESCLQGACPRGRFTYDELPSDAADYSTGNLACIATHAEKNAWYNAQFDIEFADCYVTRAPCLDCQRALFNEGLSRFVFPGGEIAQSP